MWGISHFEKYEKVASFPLQIQYCGTFNIQFIRTLFYFKIEKNKKKTQGNKKKNLILRQIYVAGLELPIPDSWGQCANRCAMEDLKLERVFFLFIDSRYS